MRAYNSNLVINILKKDYPEIENRILERIKNEVPDRLDDLNMVPKIIQSFIDIKELHYSEWTARPGQTVKPMLKDRNLLLAVLILFYHPSKILNLSSDKLKASLIIKTSIELECPKQVLKNTIADILVGFRAYKEFRDETYRVYELIKIKDNLLQ